MADTDKRQCHCQVPLSSSPNQIVSPYMVTKKLSEVDILKRQCLQQSEILVALKQILVTFCLHHPQNVSVSNDSQAK